MSEEKKENSVVNQTPKLPPGEEDLLERINGFNKEILPILGKYELGLSAEAGISPDGRIFARPIVVSARRKKEEAKVSPNSSVKNDEPKIENPDL
jgi:hypothetical protein